MVLGIVLVACKDYRVGSALSRTGFRTNHSEEYSARRGFTETDIVRNLAAANAELGDEDSAVNAYRQAIARAEKSQAIGLKQRKPPATWAYFSLSRQKMARCHPRMVIRTHHLRG